MKKDFICARYKITLVILLLLLILTGLVVTGCGGGGGGGTSSGGSDIDVFSIESPQISVNPSLSLNFGTVTVGNSSNLSVTISNAGDTDLYISSIRSPSFPYSKQSDTCSGFILAPITDACTITIQFAPAAETTYNSSFIIQSDGGNQTVYLSGTGHSDVGSVGSVGSPVLSVSPTSLNFGTVIVDNPSYLSVTVTNIGDADLHIYKVTRSSDHFSKLNDTCTGATLAPITASCSVTIRFAPTAETTYKGKFTVRSDSDSGKQTVKLSGSGQSGGFPDTNTNVTLAWDAPTTNEDGTPLTDLDGYIVYYGTSPGSYTESIDVVNVTGITIDNLSSGTWCFAVTAYDTSGNESEFSDKVCKDN